MVEQWFRSCKTLFQTRPVYPTLEVVPWSLGQLLGDEKSHRHREHPGLRVGEPSFDRLRLLLDLAGDLAQPASEGIDVPLELLLLGRGEAGQVGLPDGF
jgi:hypothetical protein